MSLKRSLCQIFLSLKCDVISIFAGGGISSTLDQSDPGSASIMNATELSQSATKKQGGRVEGLTANVPPSDRAEGVDNASSILMPVKGVIEEDKSFTFDVSPVAGLTEGETAKGWKTFSNNEVVKRSTVILPLLIAEPCFLYCASL